jgi:type VI secretion system secreted protein VgrG
MAEQALRVELNVDGKPLHAESVEARLALSEPFQLMVDALETQSPARTSKALLGKSADLTIVHPLAASPLVIHCVVAAVERVASARGARYLLQLESAVTAPLSVGLDSRVYATMTAVDVVKDVLSRAGRDGNVRWDTKATYDKRAYTIQYNESDWAFIERVCAEQGIYYFFDFDDGATKLVFADDSTNAPPIDGAAALKFREHAGTTHSEESILDVRARTAIASTKVSLDDYDPKKPLLTLDADYSDGNGPLQLYDFPGRYEQPSSGTTLSRIALEAYRARRRVLFGLFDGTRLRMGHSFEIVGHPLDELNGKAFCTAIQIEVEQRFASEGDRQELPTLRLRWEAIPGATPFRPAPRLAARIMPGPQTAVVCGPSGQETHTNDSGQIRAQFFWDRVGKRDDHASTWMRVGQFAVANSMIIPRCGWEIIVEHHNGDGDRPFIVEHLYDGKFRVPYTLPANKTRTSWQTATTPSDGSSNEIRFEDKTGAEEIFINASKDMQHTIGDNAETKVGANHTHKVGSNHTVKIGSNAQLAVTGPQQVKVGAIESLTVSGSRSTDIGGSDTQSIGAARMATVSNGRTLVAKGGRSLSVGAAMMDVSAMGVSRSVLGSTSVTVGGAWISVAPVGLGNATGGAVAETVGGAKLQLGGKGVMTTVKGALAETVGGAYIAAAGTEYGETAKGALSITVGGAMLANGPEILIEATDEISITVGGSSLKVTSDSVELKAPSLASPGATIDKDGSAIHHNP